MTPTPPRADEPVGWPLENARWIRADQIKWCQLCGWIGHKDFPHSHELVVSERRVHGKIEGIDKA